MASQVAAEAYLRPGQLTKTYPRSYALGMENILTTENMLLLGAAFGLAIFLFSYARPKEPVNMVGADATRKRLKNGEDILILDVRTPGEFVGELGHIKGAINLPLGQLSARLKELDEQLAAYKTAPVIIVCRTENRSPKAARILKADGFLNVLAMQGGMASWCAKGFPTTKS
jgi:rhodanese-related sulfurtransferase